MSRILVVDDSPINLVLACDVLELAGHVTLKATNGREALEVAAKGHPDLVLMDLRMPVMNGTEAMLELKRNPATAHIPVVALTASAMKGDCEALLASGFDGYISKPFDATRFAQVVAGYLHGGGEPDDGDREGSD